MIDRRLGPIKILRGTQAEIDPLILEEGTLVYSTDKKRVYMGDDLTKGGVVAGNKNFLSTSRGTAVPVQAVYGDIVHKPESDKTYIVGYDTDGKTLKLILIADNNYYDSLQSQIDSLYTKYRELSACVLDNITVDKTCKCD